MKNKQVLYIIGASGLLGKAIDDHFFHPDWDVVPGWARAGGGGEKIIK